MSKRAWHAAWIGAAAFVACSSSARPGRAQACCAGANVLSPARLSLHEQALAGLLVRGSYVTGSFDAQRRYVRASGREADFEQDLMGALRPIPTLPGQIAVWLPVVQTYRKNAQTAEAGWGMGDLNLSLRYDFIAAGESRFVPGIAALAGITFPTGRPPEDSKKPLHTDVTGIGVVQGTLGVAFEQTYDKVLLNLTGLLTQRASRTIGATSTRLGLQYTVMAAAGYAFDMDTALALVVTYSTESDARIDDRVEADTGKASTNLAFAFAMAVADSLRAQATVFDALPISGLGKNQTAAAGATLALMRTWP